MANNMIWDPVNRMRDEDWIDTDGSRISDVLQLEENSEVVKDLLEVDHGTDGLHVETPPSAISTLLSPTVGSISNTVDAYNAQNLTGVFVIPAYPDIPATIYFALGMVEPSAGGGRIESGIGYTFNVDVPPKGRITILYKRRSVGAGTTATIFAAYTSNVDTIDYGVGLPVPVRLTPSDGFPLCRNHYDSIYESINRLYTLVLRGHSEAGASSINVMSLRGATLYDLGYQTFERTLLANSAYLVAAHDGEYRYVICSVTPHTTSYSNAIMVAPAFDDTSVYVGVHTYNGLGADSTMLKAYFGAIVIPDPDAEVGVANTWPDKTNKAVVDGISPTEWTNLISRVEYLEEHFNVEHAEDGANSLPVSKLQDWTVVQNDWAVTASGTVGNVTETLIEADPGGSTYYLCALIGDSGSGIVMATISRDATDVYLCLRRITPGTTNNFTARVARFTHA